MFGVGLLKETLPTAERTLPASARQKAKSRPFQISFTRLERKQNKFLFPICAKIPTLSCKHQQVSRLKGFFTRLLVCRAGLLTCSQLGSAQRPGPTKQSSCSKNRLSLEFSSESTRIKLAPGFRSFRAHARPKSHSNLEGKC